MSVEEKHQGKEASHKYYISMGTKSRKKEYIKQKTEAKGTI